MSFKNVELGGDGGKFFRLLDGENKVRLVSEETPVWTSFNRAEGTAKKYLTSEGAAKDKDARKRFAMWIIDRADGQIKLAEFGPTIMKGIQTLAKSSETSFDVLPPYDIIINRSGAGMDTEYSVVVSMKNFGQLLSDIEAAEVAKLEKVLMVLREDAEDKDQVASF